MYIATFSNNARTKKSKNLNTLYKNIKNYLLKNPKVTASLFSDEYFITKFKIVNGGLIDIPNTDNYPDTIVVESYLYSDTKKRTFTKSEYPYDCTAKDFFPNAHVYNTNGEWLTGYNLIPSATEANLFCYKWLV